MRVVNSVTSQPQCYIPVRRSACFFWRFNHRQYLKFQGLSWPGFRDGENHRSAYVYQELLTTYKQLLFCRLEVKVCKKWGPSRWGTHLPSLGGSRWWRNGASEPWCCSDPWGRLIAHQESNGTLVLALSPPCPHPRRRRHWKLLEQIHCTVQSNFEWHVTLNREGRPRSAVAITGFCTYPLHLLQQ